MFPESAKVFYDRQYGLHKDGRIDCPNSIHDLDKAHRRVQAVCRAFGLTDRLPKAEILDVGCGLGYYTKALSATGANVTGIDISQAGIDCARSTFPDCRFRCAGWPDDIDPDVQFDVIWTVGLSLINTLDVRVIHEKFVVEALRRLKPNGCILLGWGTNLSGRTVRSWSHWSIGMLREMRELSGLSAPIVPEARTAWLSWAMIRTGYLVSKEVPLFMCRMKQPTHSGFGNRAD